ncbi:alpha/beta hydrolase [Dubosiella newyorkensis]|uniref:Peptidase S9 prolyl oligopeptidase catalytic domain-containing protein n=1 Tax=Dubosiella newyorkensis TaxID=1862672 RepID=A0A1U7NNP8_9FIRM|nr:alpha/beta hydrolase [Dubosiella newyorkensis]OLU46971.1 hypothetical protein BO225_04100 [Dubosiella newyorkensis]
MKKKTKTILSASFLVSLAILSEKAYRYVFDRNAKPFEVKNKKQAPMPNVDKIEKLKIEAEKKVQQDCFETFHRINPNGDRLYATFFPSKDPSQKFILCSHGYKTTGIHEFAPFLPFYIQQDLNVLIVDHQAHGHSEGKTITFGILESRDLLDWVYWLIEHFGKDIEIAIHGISMGAASALALCDQVPSQVRFIVEDCGYTNAFQQLQDTIQLAKLPKLTALFLAKDFTLHTGCSLKKFDPLSHVKHSKVPLLIVHGKEDPLVPFPMAQEISNACPREQATLFVDQAGHAQSYFLAKETYQEMFKRFIEKYMQKARN